MAEENPNVVRKYFTSAFVLDKVKLTRILNIVEDRFNEDNSPAITSFEVVHANGKTINLNSLEDLFSLDNTLKNPIVQLKGDVKKSEGLADSIAGQSENNECSFGFEKDDSRNIRLSVRRKDSSKLANQIFAEIEEQIERTFLNGWLYKLDQTANQSFYSSLLPKVAASFIVLVSFFVVTSLGLFTSQSPNPSPELTTENKLEKAQEASNTDAKIDFLFQLEIEKLKVEQAKNSRREGDFKLPNLRPLFTLKLLFIVLPIFLILGCTIYVVGWCYPKYVFLWGDYEQYYTNVVNKRRYIWNVIIISTVLGTIINLFAFSLSGYMS